MGTHRINYAASRSGRERRGASWGAAPAASVACSTPSCPEWARTLNLVRDKVKVQTDIQLAERRDLSLRCRVWVPGLTRFRWRRWSGNRARGWKCRRDTSQVQLQAPAATRASSPVRGLLDIREHIIALIYAQFYARDGATKHMTQSYCASSDLYFINLLHFDNLTCLYIPAIKNKMIK